MANSDAWLEILSLGQVHNGFLRFFKWTGNLFACFFAHLHTDTNPRQGDIQDKKSSKQSHREATDRPRLHVGEIINGLISDTHISRKFHSFKLIDPPYPRRSRLVAHEHTRHKKRIQPRIARISRIPVVGGIPRLFWFRLCRAWK